MDGKMIAEKRKEKGLTQDALGAMLGISGKAVLKWERGLPQSDASHIGKLTELLGLPVEQTADEADTRLKFLSTVKREVPRILSVGVMLAACVCFLMGTISTDSTIVAFGFSVAVFCFGTMIREK